MNTLSGGQRRRVELARILFGARAEDGSSTGMMLLLDEPTNHLDADSIVWLRDYLKHFGGGVVIISHDVDLLAAVVNKVWFLDAVRGELDVYNMTWQRYLEARSTDEQRRRRERANAEKKASVLMTQAAKLGAKATKAAAAHQMVRRAEKLIAGLDDVRVADRVAKIRFPQPAACGRTPLTASNLSKSYGSLEIFTGVDLAIDRGSRVVVLGLNGAGKTTLLKLLGNVEKPDTGEVRGRARPAAGVLRAGARDHRSGTHGLGEHPAAPRRTPVRRNCGTCSAPSCSPASSSNNWPARCPAARRPGWRWPGWCPRRPTCCCWTNRPTTSTRPAGSRCWTRCAGTPAPLSWSRTIPARSPRCTRSGSSCCRTAPRTTGRPIIWTWSSWPEPTTAWASPARCQHAEAVLTLGDVPHAGGTRPTATLAAGRPPVAGRAVLFDHGTSPDKPPM